MDSEFSEDLLFQCRNLEFVVNNIAEFVAIINSKRRLFDLDYSTSITVDHFHLVIAVRFVPFSFILD